MNTIIRFAGSTVPSYFLGRPRRVYEGRYDNTGRASAGHAPMPSIVPRVV